MTQLPNHIFIAFGAIVAAIITGIFSYITLIATKESKISEFRQNWINDLRNEISQYISSIHGLIEHLIRDNQGQAISTNKFMEKKNDHSELYNKMLNSKISILLRINDNEREKEFKNINDAVLEHVEKIHNDFENKNFQGANEKIDQLVSKSRKLLKYEWNRARDGEKNYAKTKTIAFRAVIISIVLLFILSGWKIFGTDIMTVLKAKF